MCIRDRTDLQSAPIAHGAKAVLIAKNTTSTFSYVDVYKRQDYLTKPFRPTILLMKVKALLRRVEMDRGKTAAAEDELHYGDIRYSCLLYTSRWV